MKLLVFDIETVRAFKELSEAPEAFVEAWTAYAKSRYSEQTPEEAFIDKAGFHPEFAKVVCISATYSANKDEGIVSFNGSEWVDDTMEWTLLKKFGDRITQGDWKNARLVGHYIKGFDIPFLVTRFAVNGLKIPPALKLYGQKPWEMSLIDTRDVWKQGLYQSCNAATLQAVCNAMNIESPKQEISGADVADVYFSGDEDAVQRITTYCEADVQATAELVNKMYKLKMI